MDLMSFKAVAALFSEPRADKHATDTSMMSASYRTNTNHHLQNESLPSEGALRLEGVRPPDWQPRLL